MRIAHYYADLLADGGCPSNLRFLAEAQLGLGHRVSGFGFTNPRGNHPMPEGMGVVQAPRTPAGLRRLIRGILSLTPRPDVVQVWSPLIIGNEWVLREVHRAGIPTLVTLQGHLDPFLYSHGRSVQKRIYRRVALGPALKRWTDAIHAQSQYEEGLARDLGYTGVIYVFPLGTPAGMVPPLSRPGPMRRDLGIPDDHLLVGFFGRLDPVQKRFEALIPSMARCRDLLGDETVHFVLAGKGSDAERRETRRMLREHGLDDVVPMPGPYMGDDRFRALADLDVLLHPSRFEGLPRVIREAAAVGVPSVVSVQANAELLVEAGGALLTDTTPSALDDAIRSAVGNAQWRAEASTAAMIWAAENDWIASARHFLAAYEELVAARA